MSDLPRLVCWFSCGSASAVNTKLAIAKYGATHEIAIARCVVPEEDGDNDRFAADCERWFDRPVISLRSSEYASCEDVWTRRRYMSGPQGAACTLKMKKEVRWEFEAAWLPDLQAFGYTSDEKKRMDRFRLMNPEVRMVSLLAEKGLKKEDCHAIVRRAGILLPLRYRQGFDNANCKGCVNAQSPRYWNLERRVNPEVFEARAVLSRELGVRLVKLTSGARPRVFLDELPPDDFSGEEPASECSLLCYSAEQEIDAAS